MARVGDIENARAASGPTPDFVPDNVAFRTFASAMRALQLEGGLIVEIFDEPDEGRRVVMTVRGGGLAAQRVRDYLGMAQGADRLVITDRAAEGGAISVRGRSILGILAALSQTVQAPAAHQGALVTATPAGADWQAVIGDMFAVQVAERRPENAAVAVRYRGYWFYIPDTDLQSKSTLDLVNHLFALQAARGQAGAVDPFIVLSPGQ